MAERRRYSEAELLQYYSDEAARRAERERYIKMAEDAKRPKPRPPKLVRNTPLRAAFGHKPSPPMPKPAMLRPTERRAKQHTVPKHPGKPSARARPATTGQRLLPPPESMPERRPPFERMVYTRHIAKQRK